MKQLLGTCQGYAQRLEIIYQLLHSKKVGKEASGGRQLSPQLNTCSSTSLVKELPY